MSSTVCYKCNRTGHFARECSQGGSSGGGFGGFGGSFRGRGGPRGGGVFGRGGEFTLFLFIALEHLIAILITTN